MGAPSLRTLLSLLVLPLFISPAQGGAQAPDVPPLLSELRFRSIGPAVTGGRIHDVEAVPGHAATLYVATASGGLWKTTNGGVTWRSLFDAQPVSTFGDVALAPSNPEVVWAGTGEQNNRQSTSWGNGVYRSTDGGTTWTHVGLDSTRHIGRIVVDPGDPDVAYVAAMGNLWKPSADRGVYRTRDGGRSWTKVLYVDTLTGAVDLAIDPTDGRTVYAATYPRLRRTWGYNGGGAGGGIWKTTDGGEHWTRLSGGLPAGPLGRIGLAISAQNPRLLVARVEHATRGGVYRSEDGGQTWTRVNELNPRPSYYGGIWIDPTDAQRVYLLSTDAYMSEDGGRSFRELPTAPTYDVGVHSDHHGLWIDPGNSEHLYLAGDGGLYESWDRGTTYRKLNNFAIGQIYNVGADDEEPYNVYIGLQDNHSWMGPSATRRWAGILNDDWKEIGFGDGMYQTVDPAGRYVYTNSQGNSYTRVDTRTGDILEIAPRAPEGGPEYRFEWTAPSMLDRFDPATLYVGGNRLFISHDRGGSWQPSDDLTKRIDRDTLTLMGVRGSEPMLSKNDGTESYGEITTMAQSPLERGVLWVGTDDGNIQLSRDGGRSWSEVGRNIPRAGTALTPRTYVSRVTASAAGAGTAYAALDAHRDGDFRPYLFRTTDFGRTWTPLSAGLPEDGSVNDIVEHPNNASLLFVGTEHALFVSLDAGAHWQRLGANLPTTLYDDLLIHPRANDLIVATHGRSVWILDDVAPLAEWTGDVATEKAHLFSIRPVTLFQFWKNTSYRGQADWAGENPAYGAIVSYYLGQAAPDATLTVRNGAGEVVRTLKVAGEAGIIHRVAWDLRHDLPFDVPAQEVSSALPHPAQPLGMRGPLVSPGTYRVTLEAGGVERTQTVELRPDPLMPTLEPSDYAARERFNLDLLELVKRVDALGRGDARPTQALRRDVLRLYGDLNGAAVQQGSLHPPTPQMLERKQALERRLETIARQGGREGQP